MRFPFDLGPVYGIPWTRMAGSATVGLNPVYYRHARGGWVAVMVFALGASAVPMMAGMPLAQKLAQKHETRHEIDQLEDEWRNAVLTSNISELNSLLADDYMAITPSGTLQTKEESLDYVRSGRVHFTTLDITDRKVRFYGTTAVVTSLAFIQATTADGPLSGSYRYTRVYARDPEGKWKIVSFEASRVRVAGRHKATEFH
jgi:ketosteroid isomerase-like protein